MDRPRKQHISGYKKRRPVQILKAVSRERKSLLSDEVKGWIIPLIFVTWVSIIYLIN